MSKAAPSHPIAQRLREARKRIFPSAAAAAEALAMKPGTVRAHENGQNGISFEDMEMYARRYGVTMDWIITGRGSMEPDEKVSVSDWNLYNIMGQIRDGVWIEGNTDADTWPGWGALLTPAGLEEEVEYSDPRFPDDLINALKVRTDIKDGPYIDGSIIFAVSSVYTDMNEGDHVVTVREKGDFVEWSLREVHYTGKATVLKSLISDSPPYVWNYDEELPNEINIVATVIGCLTRRPVPPMTAAQRRAYEDEGRHQRKMGSR